MSIYMDVSTCRGSQIDPPGKVITQSAPPRRGAAPVHQTPQKLAKELKPIWLPPSFWP